MDEKQTLKEAIQAAIAANNEEGGNPAEFIHLLRHVANELEAEYATKKIVPGMVYHPAPRPFGGYFLYPRYLTSDNVVETIERGEQATRDDFKSAPSYAAFRRQDWLIMNFSLDGEPMVFTEKDFREEKLPMSITIAITNATNGLMTEAFDPKF